ncbi:MAG: hypothetical protein KCHDKBKB_01737 [Elusimicrobia bacterium]|nr:hypothetical protein [Elusimicrobiota bacterium]
MGDMCDIPNFHRNWFQRLGLFKIILGALGILLAALVWSFSEEPIDSGLSLSLDPQNRPVMIGSPYSVKAVLKNEADQTMSVELQVVLYSKESTCMEKGKNLKFSHLLKLRIAPNDSVTTNLNFDNIVVPCEMSAGLKAFVNGEIDGKRFPLTQDTDLSIEIL